MNRSSVRRVDGRPGDGASMGNNDRGRAAPLTSIREDSNVGTGFPKVI